MTNGPRSHHEGGGLAMSITNKPRSDAMSNATEDRALALAQEVLAEKRQQHDLLVGSVEYFADRKPEWIGFTLAVKHPTKGEHQVAARPAIEAKGVTKKQLAQAFDEGMAAIDRTVEAEKEKN